MANTQGKKGKNQMTDEQVTLIGQIKAKNGCEQDVKQELQLLIGESRKEPGNIHYDLYQAIDNESLFLFHETWKDQKALDEHMDSPYLKRFISKEGELLAEPIKGKKVNLVD